MSNAPNTRNLLVILTRGLRSDALDDERAWPLRTPRIAVLAQRGLRLVACSASPADPGGRACYPKDAKTGNHRRFFA